MLKDKWPAFLQELVEFQAISAALTPEGEGAGAAVAGMAAEFTAYTLSEWGAQRWEDILALAPPAGEGLDKRRMRILSRIVEQPPITKRVLYGQLRALAGDEGFTMDIDYGTHTLEVRLVLAVKFAREEVRALLERSIPAEMLLTVDLLYNTHAVLGQHTHRQLAAYTQEELRSEVIP